MAYAIMFVLGSIIGSFLNVCIYRIPREMSVITPGSHCPMCKGAIPPHDNIPILSYIILGGKCKICQAPIPLRYFLIEVFVGILFVAIYANFGASRHFLSYSALTSFLVIATFVDMDFQLVPDNITFGSLITGLVLSLASPNVLAQTSPYMGLAHAVLGALVGASMTFAMRFVGNNLFRDKLEFIGQAESMGMADVILMASIGTFVGWKLTILTFFLSSLFGAIAGSVLKMRTGKSMVPFVPYIFMAVLVSIFFGNKLLDLVF